MTSQYTCSGKTRRMACVTERKLDLPQQQNILQLSNHRFTNNDKFEVCLKGAQEQPSQTSKHSTRKDMRALTAMAIAGLVSLTACNNQEQIDRMQYSIDSVRAVISKQDSLTADMNTTFADIHENLQKIKEKEKLLNIKKAEGAPEQDIIDDIQAIYDLLLQNKKKIARLNASIAAQNRKMPEFEQLIADIQQQLDERTNEVKQLESQILKRDTEISRLNRNVAALNASIDSAKNVTQQKAENLQAATARLNEGYYIIGDKKTLIAKGVVAKKGLRGLVTTGKSDNQLFTKVDITELTQIPLTGKKHKLVSSHDASSYSLEENRLVIRDKAKFWKTTKYLIITGKDVE